MSRRERILVVIAAVVITFVGWYFYIYSPRQAEYARLTQTLQDRQAQLERMEATARQITRLEQEYRDLQSFIASVEAKLPATKDIPPLLVRLERLTVSLGVNLESITPGTLVTVSPVVAQGSQNAPAGQGQTPPPPPGTTSYLRFPMALNFIASYAEMLRLTNSLKTFPRLIVIRRITLAPRTVPDLVSTMDIETYVLPKEAR